MDEKIGQLLTICVKGEGHIKPSTIKMIQKYKIGNVILYRKNYENYEEMLNVVNELKEANRENKIPLCISIDQEGGRVNRFVSPEVTRMKNMYDLAKQNNDELLEKAGELIGEMLYETGINMDYAPVLDVKRFEDTHALGNRCFAEDAEDAGKKASLVMNGIQSKNVIAVPKHFPGHGATQKDSHFRIPKIDKKWDDLEREDIKAFEIAKENGMDAIMVGHLVIEDKDSKNPASFSKKIINDYLKKEMKFDGLVITDDLKMRAVLLHHLVPKTVIKAIYAGSNIVMVGLPYIFVKASIKKIKKEIVKNKDFEKLVDESFEKVVQMKKKYGFTDKKANGFDIAKINKKIDKINCYFHDISI